MNSFGDLNEVFSVDYNKIYNSELYSDLQIKKNANEEKINKDLHYYFNYENLAKDKEQFTNISCENILEHVKNCKHCAEKLVVIQKQNIIMTPEFLNLLTYMITGIFILFLFYLFFNLGKSLH